MGYIEFLIKEESKRVLKEVTSKIVDKEQLYYSDVVYRINGDVTNKAHFTLFFGFTESATGDKSLKQFSDSIKVKSLKTGELFLLPGFQDQYKVLCVEVKMKINL